MRGAQMRMPADELGGHRRRGLLEGQPDETGDPPWRPGFD
jgi:hypothetical protein